MTAAAKTFTPLNINFNTLNLTREDKASHVMSDMVHGWGALHGEADIVGNEL